MAVYFIRDESTGAVKIGYARDVERRRRSLQTGLPGKITTLRVLDGDLATESWLHVRFAHLHLRGEWFRYSDEMLSIRSDEIPVSCKWSSLRAYLFAIPADEREAFAVRCGTTYAHLRNVAYGQKPCGASLAINVDRESCGAVRCEDLRPDVDWAYLRQSGPVGTAEVSA